jgi:hypothetical protein
VLAGIALALVLRGIVDARMEHRRAPTWACGFPELTGTMQYSSTSFSESLSRVMQPLLGTETEQQGIVTVSTVPVVRTAVVTTEAWPVAARWSSVTEDRVLVSLYEPIFAGVSRAGAWLRGLHQARVTTSLLYIVGTMVLLLTLLFLPSGAR